MNTYNPDQETFCPFHVHAGEKQEMGLLIEEKRRNGNGMGYPWLLTEGNVCYRSTENFLYLYLCSTDLPDTPKKRKRLHISYIVYTLSRP